MPDKYGMHAGGSFSKFFDKPTADDVPRQLGQVAVADNYGESRRRKFLGAFEVFDQPTADDVARQLRQVAVADNYGDARRRKFLRAFEVFDKPTADDVPLLRRS